MQALWACLLPLDFASSAYQRGTMPPADISGMDVSAALLHAGRIRRRSVDTLRPSLSHLHPPTEMPSPAVRVTPLSPTEVPAHAWTRDISDSCPTVPPPVVTETVPGACSRPSLLRQAAERGLAKVAARRGCTIQAASSLSPLSSMGRHALGAQSASPAHDERVQLYDAALGKARVLRRSMTKPCQFCKETRFDLQQHWRRCFMSLTP